MKNVKHVFSVVVALFAVSTAMLAQGSGWTMNPNDYQYDMTIYAGLVINDKPVSDYSNFEVAAFIDGECRGIATVDKKEGKSWLYMRVRSNEMSGGIITFKIYDKQKGCSFDIEEAIVFESNGLIGMPSSPKIFTLKKYAVSFVIDGKSNDKLMPIGSVIPKPDTPDKEGYTFIGWIPEFVEGATVPVGGITYTAQWKANVYKVTYMVGGEVYTTDSVTYGAVITAPEAPNKEGHTFNGWQDLPNTMPAKDVTVTGSYTANKYKVTYILDGEVFKVEEVTYGTSVPTPEVPAREGYNFSGWGDVPATMPAGDITLTGSYTINKDLKYSLIYMVDGVEYKRVTLSFGDAIVLEEAPTKEGHTFSGWSDVPETMPLHDVTVTGSFTVNKYLVTFTIEGEIISSDSLEYGAAIVAPEAPEREGYTFDGWGELAETVPAHDVTYEGSFTVNVYKVYYYVGEELIHTIEVTYGEAMPEYIYEPEEGYTFLGWIGEVYETMPAHDVIYTANLTNGIENSEIINHKSEIIYDIHGRKVIDTENLKSGIYIVNGKKMLVSKK